MAQKTVPSDDDLLEYARRMEKSFESFQYLKEVLQAVYDAKANIPKFQEESAAAETAKIEAVAASNAAIADSQAKAQSAQADLDAKMKQLATVLDKAQSVYDERTRKLQEGADQAAKHFEAQKAENLSALGELGKQLAAARNDFENQKAVMSDELAALQSKIDALNHIMTSKRDAVLALAGAVQ